MPFTPSHAVVALPFLRSPLPAAAIAVGAMTPDLPLFVRGTPLSYAVTHGFAWLPLTASVALALLLVWRCGLRPALREISPGVVGRRLPAAWDEPAAVACRETFARRGEPAPSWRGTVLLFAALAIGAASHIVWDLFTHEGRWGVTAFPVLEEEWGPLVGFTWLQYGSSVLGLAVLAVWGLSWMRRADAAASVPRTLPSWVRWTWWLSLPAVLAGGWTVGLAVAGPLTSGFTAAHLAYRVLPPACAVWGVLTLALCIAVQVRRRRR